MEVSNTPLRWFATYGAWLPLIFFSSLTLVCAMFSPRPAQTLRRGAAVLLPLAICTPLFRYVPRHSPHGLAFSVGLFFSLILFMAILVSIRYYRSTPLERQFGSLAPIVAAHRSGDYESALRLCDGPALQRFPGANADLLRGSTLFHLRRLDEAESLLRAALTKRPPPVLEALVLDQLGQVLMEQRRNDDAVRNFQRAEELDPRRGGAFQSEAEVYLRGKYQLEKALELAQHAVEMDRKQPAEFQAVSLSTSLGALAWALAANGRTAEAREKVQEALGQSQPDSVPCLAEDHYLAGRAMLAMGDQDAASQYFQKVAELDAKGNFGFLARQELAALG